MSGLTARAPRTLVGLLAALGLVAALAMPALAHHDPANGPEVVPTTEAFPGGEPECEEGVAYRFDSPAEGDEATVAIGPDAEATITILSVDDDELTFEVEGGLAAVVRVKGGVATVDDVNVYDYSGMTGGGIAHDDGLTTPNEQGISHVDFCIVAAAAPTPTPVVTPTPTPEVTPTPTPEVTPSPTPLGENPTATPTPREDTAGGNPTPAPSGGELPDTSMGDWGQVPATVLSLVLLAALATMVYARMARQR